MNRLQHCVIKVCGQIFKQSSCSHTVKPPEQNLMSLRGFGLPKISQNLCSSGVPGGAVCPVVTLSSQGTSKASFLPKLSSWYPKESQLGVFWAGWGLQASFLWEEAPESSLCGNSYSLALPQVQPSRMENPIKNQPNTQLWQHQGWELHLSAAASSPIFFPCTQKLRERSHTCSFSPGAIFHSTRGLWAPPWATSPHNSGLDCAI